ncbi:hypothetical protein, partial [Nocardioides sp.]|uniref:HNH endonuclease signature motif containing protein n=1 Tax=Nocardioides sp. TaxID=35761 RepID=UPI0039E3C182
LPCTWARVKAGQVDGWRARRVADATMTLPQEAAAWVDVHIARRVERVGVRTLDRLIEEALARFDPEQLAEDEASDLAERRVEIARNPTGRAATTRVEAVLDTTDAHDLDAVLDEIADQLAACDGLAETKAVRRARALGMLARGEVDFGPRETDQAAHLQPRRIDLRVRVAEGETHAVVHSLTGQHLGMVSVDRLQAWCAHSHVTVRPVLDLTAEAVTASRYASDIIREQAIETARKCVFPFCERPAEACDLDHAKKWQEHGPPDQTRTSNIAPLCRHHHRVKTHSAGWSYFQLAPGEYLWTSPHGYRFHTTQYGTREITNPD